CARSGKVDYW
nr:immunoglobulin heavy chain junction region [Mus musculus]